MNPQNFAGQSKPNNVPLGQPSRPMSYGVPPRNICLYSANPNLNYFNRPPPVPMEDWLRNPETMGFLWNYHNMMSIAARSSQGVPPVPRGDYAPPPLQDMDSPYLMGRRPMFSSPPYSGQPFFPRGYPMDMMPPLQNSNISSYLREQEMRHSASFKKEDGLMPLVVEPRNRPKYGSFLCRVPDIIVVDSSSDDEVKEQKAPPKQPSVQILDKKPPLPEYKPNQPPPPPQAESSAKKTRQAKDKLVQKKNSVPVKLAPSTPTPSKKPTRALVTKPPIVDDDTITSKHLKIKIKKISKSTKPVIDANKEKERLQREKRVIEDRTMPKYSDLHGKIRSGAHHQADISEFMAQSKSKPGRYVGYSEEKESKQEQLEQRKRWSSRQNYAMCKFKVIADSSLRDRFPTVSANKIISFILEGRTNIDDAAFHEYLDSHREETKINGEADRDEPKHSATDRTLEKLTVDNQTTQIFEGSLDTSRVTTRQNLRSKTITSQ